MTESAANPWQHGDCRQLLSKLHQEQQASKVHFTYAHEVGSKRFKEGVRATERLSPTVPPDRLETELRRVRLGLHPVVPFTMGSADAKLLLLTQVNPENGQAIDLSQLVVSQFDTEKAMYLPYRSTAFNLHQVNLLGKHAAQLSEASLIPGGLGLPIEPTT